MLVNSNVKFNPTIPACIGQMNVPTGGENVNHYTMSKEGEMVEITRSTLNLRGTVNLCSAIIVYIIKDLYCLSAFDLSLLVTHLMYSTFSKHQAERNICRNCLDSSICIDFKVTFVETE